MGQVAAPIHRGGTRAYGFDVLVCYLPTVYRSRLSANPSTLRRIPIPTLPRRELAAIRLVNRIAGRAFLSVVARAWEPDAVFVTHPDVYGLLPATMSRLPVFYDCLDLAVGFARNARHRRSLESVEADLFARASLVFVPSDSLRQSMEDAGAPVDRLVVVRNGHPGTGTVGPTHAASTPKEVVDLGLVGTIADWVDLDGLLAAVEAYPALRVNLWGPSVVPLPRHEQIIWHGVVARDELDSAVRFVDAFILPFRLTELTEVVDPVKMYEYVAWGRPIISVRYPELDQFSPYVHFYNTREELLTVVGELMAGRLSAPDPEVAREFLRTSTWKARTRQMRDLMLASMSQESG